MGFDSPQDYRDALGMSTRQRLWLATSSHKAGNTVRFRALLLNMGHVDREVRNDYHRRYSRKRYSAVRQQAIAALGGRCVKCGGDSELQFDHVDANSKVVDPSSVMTGNEAKAKAELAKCQLLCRSCHREKTNLERYGVRVHGTYAMYKREGCRCDPCRKAVAVRRQTWKSSNGA